MTLEEVDELELVNELEEELTPLEEVELLIEEVSLLDGLDDCSEEDLTQVNMEVSSLDLFHEKESLKE